MNKFLLVLCCLFSLSLAGCLPEDDSNTSGYTAPESLIGLTWVGTIETVEVDSGLSPLDSGETLEVTFISENTIYGKGKNEINSTTWSYTVSGSEGAFVIDYDDAKETINLTASNEQGTEGTFRYLVESDNGKVGRYTGTYQFNEIPMGKLIVTLEDIFLYTALPAINVYVNDEYVGSANIRTSLYDGAAEYGDAGVISLLLPAGEITVYATAANGLSSKIKTFTIIEGRTRTLDFNSGDFI